MKKILLHIGYPKTGTTWLQKNIFPNVEEVNYIGRTYKNQNYLKRITYKSLNYFPFTQKKYSRTPDDYWIDLISYAPDAVYNEVKTANKLTSLIVNDKLNVISNENLVRPFSVERTARRLRNICNKHEITPSIVISIREQYSIILSRHYQDTIIYNKNKKYKLTEAINLGHKQICYAPACKQKLYRCDCFKKELVAINLDFYNYYNSYKTYAEVFGKENVYILVSENLLSSPYKALTGVFNHVGLNKEISNLRELSKSEPTNKRASVIKKEIDLFNSKDLKQVKEQIKNYYRESNLLLNKMTSIDLENYGYF